MNEIKPWRRKETSTLADCRILTLCESISVCPRTDDEHRFIFIDSADWVNIVPVTRAGEIVMIRQFRHGSQDITLEIPGGMVDPGEDAASAAARECREESGYSAGRVEPLGVLNPNPALFQNKLYTFVAHDCEKVGEIENTATEHTEVELIPMDQLADLLVDGTIDHALVVATLWRLLAL